ncbi:Retinol dehydrogenase 16 [Bulinus truncatus]|nr:Retinol dehydrogenase 16 [Bulinus truncatus]
MRILKVGNYEEKYVMITGCDSGFGQCLACHLDSLGFHVFAGCLTEDGMKYLKEKCSNRLTAVHLDVTKKESIESALEEVKRSLPEDKGLWGLVNNAGILGHVGVTEALTKEDYLEVFDVNVFGLIEVTRHFLPLVRKAKGRVVNTASVAGRLALLLGTYSVSKFCVEAYSDILRRELYHCDIKICIIEPGYFQTPICNFEKMRADANMIFSKRSTEEMKETYGDVEALYVKMYSPGSQHVTKDITPVVEAYTHALTSRYPRTRYSAGWDAKLVYIPLSYLPTWISDRVMALPKSSRKQS